MLQLWHPGFAESEYDFLCGAFFLGQLFKGLEMSHIMSDELHGPFGPKAL
jgi:hypothetical protein